MDKREVAGVHGHGWYELIGPDGELKQRGEFDNLITDYGDEYYARKGSGVSAPTTITGMRLGTGTTAVAKNGAGAAIVTYVSASNKAIDGGYPTSATKGAGLGFRNTFVSTWAAGSATASGIAECVITNETGPSDVAGSASNTVSRFLLSPTVNKGAGDSLVITVQHDLLGA